jgi:hypothetical protein
LAVAYYLQYWYSSELTAWRRRVRQHVMAEIYLMKMECNKIVIALASIRADIRWAIESDVGSDCEPNGAITVC